MKKLVLLPISLSLFVLTMFFSCTKDTQVPNVGDVNPDYVLNMAEDKDGILNLTISPEDSESGAVTDRDGDCTMYEALRFTGYTQSGTTITPDPNARVNVHIEFRLLKIHKSTGTRTALTNYTTVTGTNGQGVGGLNITWYPYSPLSDYWYAIGIKNCTRAVPILGDQTFIISDFWNHDFMVHIDPWNNYVDRDFLFGPISNANPDEIGATITLLEECTISAQ